MKPHAFAVALIVMSALIPTSARAQEESAAPPEPPPFMREGEMDRRGGMGRGPEWWRGREGRFRGEGEEMTDERWAAIEKFMKTHSPERTRRLEEVPEDRRDNLKRAIARRYDQIHQIREREPGMYELRLKRLAIEDQIFALSLQLKEESTSETVKQLHGKLDEQVTALFRNSVQERRLRLKQARQRLDQAQTKLEEDRANEQAIVKALVKGIIEEDRWPTLGPPAPGDPRLGGEGPRGPGGPGGPGGPSGPGEPGGRFRGPGGGEGRERSAAPATQPAEE